MLKTVTTFLIGAALMFAAPAFAVDGVVLINQSTVMATGGFPYRITQPGSYKLSGNLVVPDGVDGIDILADDITIDLNGFRISGTAPGSPPFPAGISGNATAVTIRNGTILGFNVGIDLGGSNHLIEEIHATGSNLYGILIAGAVVRRNTASGNGSGGIHADNSLVIENVSNSNRGNGLIMRGGLYGSNTFDGNAGPAVIGTGVSQNNNDCDGASC